MTDTLSDVTAEPATADVSDTEVWRDVTQPVPARVDALLAEMTLAEKIAQLGSRWVGNDLAEEPADDGARDAAQDHQSAPMQDVFAASSSVTLAEASRHGWAT